MNFRNIITIIILGIMIALKGLVQLVSVLTKTNSVLGNLITVLLIALVVTTLTLLVQQL